jgi:hypothetical protein
MELKDILTIAASIILSIGGAGAIIIGVSKWFGDLIASRILDNYKFKHERDLENLKKDYQKELEITKSELDKSKHQFLKYSDEQFTFYNKLWKIFWHVKKSTDTLWKTKDPEKLPSFSRLLDNVKEAVYENILVIDQEHSDKLLSLIHDFEQIRFETYQLSDLRKSRVVPVEPKPKEENDDADDDFDDEVKYGYHEVVVLSADVVSNVLEENKPLKNSFDVEILAVANIFRVRMRGGQNST